MPARQPRTAMFVLAPLSFVLLLLPIGCVHDSAREQLPLLAAEKQTPSPQPLVSPDTNEGEPGPRISPRSRLPPANGIVLIGDSITVGLGEDANTDCLKVNPERSGVGPRLRALERSPVINEGICGNTSFGGKDRVSLVLERRRPSLLLILFSPNDQFNEIDAVIDNLRFIIRAAQRFDAVPVIGTLTPARGRYARLEPFILALNAKIRELASAEQIALADHHLTFTSKPAFRAIWASLLANDGLHPNGKGYDAMATTWSRAIRNARPATGPLP